MFRQKKLAQRILQSKRLAEFPSTVAALATDVCVGETIDTKKLTEQARTRLMLDFQLRNSRQEHMPNINPGNLDKSKLESYPTSLFESIRLRVLAKILQISDDQLTLALEENSAQFTYDTSTNKGLLYLAMKDKALRNFVDSRLSKSWFCSLSKRLTEEKQKLPPEVIDLTSYYPLTSKNSPSPGPFSSCVTCHVGADAVAPLLPFDNPETMKLMLRNPKQNAFAQNILYRIDAKDDSRMPRVQILDESAKQAIRKFIDHLKGQ